MARRATKPRPRHDGRAWATYRLQFGPAFRFADAVQVLPYLQALGVTHVYASPYFMARPGSTHGYDVVDHNRINPEIGSDADFDRYCAALRRHGLGQILDFVPNHMGIGGAGNAWWLDVLEWGEASVYARFFDIDWESRKSSLRGKVLLPFLGQHYGEALETGTIELRFDAESGTFSVWYHEHRFPIRPRDYGVILRVGAAELRADVGCTAEAQSWDFASAVEALAAEFAAACRGSARRAGVRDAVAALKRRLGGLAREDAAHADGMRRIVESFRGRAGDSASFRRLHALLERQHYRLSYWRVAADEINYRRFFDVNDLVGLRVENLTAFAACHDLVKRLIRDGRIDGLRIDHVDGLHDPEEYCRRLQSLARDASAPSAGDRGPRDFYVIVEKILARHERLRDTWQVAGTTGYEFLNLLNGLFVDPTGERGIAQAYHRFLGATADFDSVLEASKRLVVDSVLPSELRVLADALDRLSERNWRARDYARARLRAALREIVVGFPVYRTYVARAGALADDRRDILWAAALARKRWRGVDIEIIDFVVKILTTDILRDGGGYPPESVANFARRFQQYTGPVMAKAMEDTSFYRFVPLMSLNEVGGDPRVFGVSPAAFHRANQERAERWPSAMLATATHDTKRGEDSRARINVLSELASVWGSCAQRWARLNRTRRSTVGGRRAPSRNAEYLIYQAMVGGWPNECLDPNALPAAAMTAFAARLEAYVVKALRESKEETSWANPDADYEAACVAFVRGVLDMSRSGIFLAEFVPFAARVARAGMLNGLAQTVLKLTVPGIPDTYQGCESWDLRFVDPDNRQAVDFGARMAILEDFTTQLREDGARPAFVRDLMDQWPDGRIKLYVVSRLLALRRQNTGLFSSPDYRPLDVEGAGADRMIGFERRHGPDRIVVAAARFFAGHAEDRAPWFAAPSAALLVDGDKSRESPWTDWLSGRTLAAEARGHDRRGIPAETLFRHLPVAVLLPGRPGSALR